MLSSPRDAGVALTPVAFALQELAACWNQGYEALARGDLERVSALLAIAADHVATAGDGGHDTVAEAALRTVAAAAHGRLQHGVSAGLVGIEEELARARVGGKALRGYAEPARPLGSSVVRDA